MYFKYYFDFIKEKVSDNPWNLQKNHLNPQV